MRQLILPGGWDGGPTCSISGREARRLISVLRLGPGDELPALGPDGRRYDCVILSASRSELRLSVSEAAGPGSGYLPDVRGSSGKARQEDAAPSDTLNGAIDSTAAPEYRASVPRLVLAVGLLKGSRLDEAVRAAAEAGVAAVVPLVTERSQARDGGGARVERLRRVAAEALGQSGSPVATRVEEPMDLAAFLAAYPADGTRRLGLYFHEAPLAQVSLHRYCSDGPEEIVACVGPEGGLGDGERERLTAGGYRPAWLGPAVLRAETAAVFAVASLRIVCLERYAWSVRE